MPTVESTVSEVEEEKPPPSSTPKNRPGGATAKPNTSGAVRAIILRSLLVVPYLVGIAWTLAHPIISIVTGELKCRGWYIDENSLEASYLRLSPPYALVGAARMTEHRRTSLCGSLEEIAPTDGVSCHHQRRGFFEVAKIEPISGAVKPISESIVIVVPFCENWMTSNFHFAVLQLVGILSSPLHSPWLAKTVFIVSPSQHDTPIDGTVAKFLDSCVGTHTKKSNAATLPPDFTTGILRNLIVLSYDEIQSRGERRNEVWILPQGKRGVLPNMDLVFMIMSVYSRAPFMDSRLNPSIIRVHPHAEDSPRWHQWVMEQFPNASAYVRNWATELGDLALFARTMAVGPFPPHAPGLDRGIDSLTIHARLSGQDSHVVDFVQQMEKIVRALSNLHERLHHSTTQYLMPSPYKFVSHSEYLIPNILLLLPLVVRAVTLILLNIEKFSFGAVEDACWAVVPSMIIHLVSNHVDDMTSLHILVIVLYVSVMAGFVTSMGRHRRRRRRRREGGSDDDEKIRVLLDISSVPKGRVQSLQFLSCLAGIYLHVPLALGHVALAFPSALLWTPTLLLMTLNVWSCGDNRETKATTTPSGNCTTTSVGCRPRPRLKLLITQRFLLAVLVSVLWPLLWIVPHVFGRYTAYITLVYIPLHLLQTQLLLGMLLSSSEADPKEKID